MGSSLLSRPPVDFCRIDINSWYHGLPSTIHKIPDRQLEYELNACILLQEPKLKILFKPKKPLGCVLEHIDLEM